VTPSCSVGMGGPSRAVRQWLSPGLILQLCRPVSVDGRGLGSTHGGSVCQVGVLCWPGDLLLATGLARDCCAGFLAGELVRAAERAGSSWSARSVGARSGRARTNVLDVGKWRPMIGS